METIRKGKVEKMGWVGRGGGTSAEEEPSRTALWVLGLKVSWMNKAASVGSKKASVFSTHIIQRGWTGCRDKAGMSGSCQEFFLIHFSRPGLPRPSPPGDVLFSGLPASVSLWSINHFGDTRGGLLLSTKGLRTSPALFMSLGWANYPCLLPTEFKSKASGKHPSGQLKGSWEGQD